jgi:hypothetical protein
LSQRLSVACCGPPHTQREILMFIGTQFSNLYTAVDTQREREKERGERGKGGREREKERKREERENEREGGREGGREREVTNQLPVPPHHEKTSI